MARYMEGGSAMWRLVLISVAVLTCCGLAYGGSAANPDFAAEYRGLPERWQWRYWVSKEGYDVDRRLDQTVNIEIVGRAIAPALELLSKQTGVSLRILPKDVKTLGERKVTLVAHESSLKAAMVQVARALQESHWDIEWTAAQPVYDLCRDSGPDPTGEAQREAARQAARAAKRAARMETLKRALAMSPEELREFEKEDLFLARALQDENTRSDAALFAALSPDDLRTFVDTGRVQPRYRDLSGPQKEAFDRLLERMAPAPRPEAFPQEERAHALLRDRINRWCEGSDPRADFVDTGVYYGVGLPGIFLEFSILPALPTERSRYGAVALLNPEGTPEGKAAASAIVSQWIDRGRAQEQGWDSAQQREADEPIDPDLLRPVRLQSSGPTELAQLQREIASQTGLSVASDCFTERRITVAGNLREPTPLWRVLNALSAESNRTWAKAGGYLVFSHTAWQGMAAGEIPESVIAHYREKIAKVGHLTVADAAEFAAAWEGKPARAYGIPLDLQEAGLNYPCPCLLLYASLTPEQIAAAHRSPGLPCRELSAAQRERLAAMARDWSEGKPVDMDAITEHGYFRIEEKATKQETVVRLIIQTGKDLPSSVPTYLFPEMGARQQQ